MAAFDRPFIDLNGRLVSKAMDDRISVAVMIETLKELEGSPHELYFVFTTQEEVGLRGATTAAYGVDPDLALAVDVTGTGDTPKGVKMEVALGKGPAVKVRDSGMLSDPRVVRWMAETAEKAGYPLPAGSARRRHHRCARHPADPLRRSGRLHFDPDPLHPQPVGNGGLQRCAAHGAAAGGIAQPPDPIGMKPERRSGFPARLPRRKTPGGGSQSIDRRAFKSRTLPWLSLMLLAALSALSACSSLEGLWQRFSAQAPTATRPAPLSPTPTPTPLTQGIPPTRAVPPPEAMVLWLPPGFDPNDGSRAGELLRARLAQFERQNNVQLEVRLKAESGPSGLLESLSAASAAAPLTMPAVVALPRPDLESAALKGLLTPLDGLSNAIDDPDWFDYARELALVQGVTFGLPFAGDGMVLAYRPAKIAPGFTTWEDTLNLNESLAFPAASPLSLTTVALYRAVGGEVEDAQRRPTLQPEKLAEVFDLYRSGAVRGLFPVWLTSYETDAQVWQVYKDGTVNACLTWTSFYMDSHLPDSLIAPLPRLGSSPSTLATGWAWAVADPLPERRQLSARLVEWLSEANFLAQWSEAAGVLPTRPKAVEGWQDQSLKAILEQVARAAHARPSNDLLNSLGPVLEEAGVKVIRLKSEPGQAAAQAAERLANPESR